MTLKRFCYPLLRPPRGLLLLSQARFASAVPRRTYPRCFRRQKKRTPLKPRARFSSTPPAQEEGEEKDAPVVWRAVSVPLPTASNIATATESSDPDAATTTTPEKKSRLTSELAVDRRVIPITLGSFFMGISLSMVIPLLPLFVNELGLTISQFGMTLSIVGFARMFTNIPLVAMCDKYGRRPFLVYGPLFSAMSTLFLGGAQNVGMLLLGRTVQGISGSAQMSGAMLYLADISTRENRARTLAPPMIAWSAGGMLGPAVGGWLVDSYGLRVPFFVVGSMISGVSALNWYLIPETLNRPSDKPLKETIKEGVYQWPGLVANPNIRLIVGLHTCFWMLYSGAVFTCLPLLLTNQIGASAGQVGLCFALNAAINVCGSQPAAWVSDKMGRKRTILPGGLLVFSGVSLLPYATNFYEALGAMSLFAMGNSILGTSPTAFCADSATKETRSQALAFLRTGGDAGLMLGAASCGLLADLYGLGATMHTVAGCYLLVLLRFQLGTTEPVSDDEK